MMTISGHNPNQHTILNSKPPKYLERRVDNCVCLLLRPGGREAHLDAEAEDGRLDLCFAQRAIGVIFASHTVGMTVSGALYIGANFDPVSPVLTLRQGNASEVFRMQWTHRPTRRRCRCTAWSTPPHPPAAPRWPLF